MTGPAGVLAGVAACGVALVVQSLVRKHLCGYKPCAYNQNCLPRVLRAENNNQKNKCSVFSASVSPQGNNQKNDDEDERKKHPNGIYKDAGYHHQNSRGHKSPAPTNGQRSLDNSIEVCAQSHVRVAIDSGEIVVLYRTSPGVYHGHVRTWKNLQDQCGLGHKIMNALIKNGLVMVRGKILV